MPQYNIDDAVYLVCGDLGGCEDLEAYKIKNALQEAFKAGEKKAWRIIEAIKECNDCKLIPCPKDEVSIS